jgi:hypothetical protein
MMRDFLATMRWLALIIVGFAAVIPLYLWERIRHREWLPDPLDQGDGVDHDDPYDPDVLRRRDRANGARINDRGDER